MVGRLEEALGRILQSRKPGRKRGISIDKEGVPWIRRGVLWEVMDYARAGKGVGLYPVGDRRSERPAGSCGLGEDMIHPGFARNRPSTLQVEWASELRYP